MWRPSPLDRRWFALRRDELQYFSEMDESDHKGTFRLMLSTEVAPTDVKPHALRIFDGERELFVEFDTASEQAEWAEALRANIALCKL